MIREEIDSHEKIRSVAQSITYSKIMGKKFTVLILRNLKFSNQAKFNKMLDSIEEINAKTLSSRLKEMEKDGLVERKICHKNYS